MRIPAACDRASFNVSFIWVVFILFSWVSAIRLSMETLNSLARVCGRQLFIAGADGIIGRITEERTNLSVIWI